MRGIRLKLLYRQGCFCSLVFCSSAMQGSSGIRASDQYLYKLLGLNPSWILLWIYFSRSENVSLLSPTASNIKPWSMNYDWIQILLSYSLCMATVVAGNYILQDRTSSGTEGPSYSSTVHSRVQKKLYQWNCGDVIKCNVRRQSYIQLRHAHDYIIIYSTLPLFPW